MYVCVHIYISIYVYAYIYVCIRPYVSIYAYACVYICVCSWREKEFSHTMLPFIRNNKIRETTSHNVNKLDSPLRGKCFERAFSLSAYEIKGKIFNKCLTFFSKILQHFYSPVM